jgi:glycosyltransferase involved in cell wall biosynthesis
MMRIAMAAKGVFPYRLGGLEKFTAFLANALVDEGAYVEVIAPIGKPLCDGFEPKYREINIDWPSIKPHKLAYYVFSKKVRDYIAKSDFDIANGQGSSLWTYVDVKKIPCIYNPQGMQEYYDPRMLKRLEKPFHLFFNRKIARKSDAIISPGGILTDGIIKFLKVRREKVHIIPNAVDLEFCDGFRPKNLKRGKNSFLFVGNISYYKGIIDLVNAFKVLDSKAELNIIGDGDLFKALKRNNRDTRINFLGKVADQNKLFEFYWSSDAFICPSLFEGMPTAAIEAMACGLPIISTNIGGLPDLVDGRNGLIVPPGNPKIFAEAVRKYISLPEEEKERMRTASRQKVEDRFTWQKVAAQTMDLINKLVGNKY